MAKKVTLHQAYMGIGAGIKKTLQELEAYKVWQEDAATALAVFMTLGANADQEAWAENAVRAAELLNKVMPNAPANRRSPKG